MSKSEAIQRFKDGNPSTEAFTALGLPFDAFLRYAQHSGERQAAIRDAIVRHFDREER